MFTNDYIYFVQPHITSSDCIAIHLSVATKQNQFSAFEIAWCLRQGVHESQWALAIWRLPNQQRGVRISDTTTKPTAWHGLLRVLALYWVQPKEGVSNPLSIPVVTR